MNPPANWYPDPTGRHGQRYWDGQQWTEHVFSDGVQAVDPLEQATATTGDTGDAGEDTWDTHADEAPADETPADTAPDTDVTDTEAHDGSAGTEAPDEPTDTEVPDEPTDIDAGEGPADTDTVEEPAQDDAAPAFDEPAAGSDATSDSGPEPAQFADAEGAQLTPPGVADPSQAAAAGAEPPTGGEDADLWTPDGQDTAEESDGGVAPEVESEDVVATMDEVAPAEDEQSDQEDAPIAGSDMSDAFVLAPETVSRLITRRQPAPEADDEGAGSGGAIDAPPPVVDGPPIDAPPPTVEAAPADDGAATDGPATSSVPTDAPPPSMDEGHGGRGGSGGSGGLGITGDLVGGAFAEREEAGPVALQNTRLLRCTLGGTSGVVARQGTMVAYQGEVSFDRQGAGGVARALKRAATGEGLAMMRVEGTGDVFFADGAQHVFLLHLDSSGPGLSVNGRNVLAFSGSLQWDIERIKGATLLAGGLFNTTLTGDGWVALVSDGEPVVLRTDEAPTYVDVNALVAWSAGLSTRVVSSVNAKALVGLGSGEAFQMAFDGAGLVVVQPSEGVAGAATGN